MKNKKIYFYILCLIVFGGLVSGIATTIISNSRKHEEYTFVDIKDIIPEK